MIKIYSLDFTILFQFRKILHHIFICNFLSRCFYEDCALYTAVSSLSWHWLGILCCCFTCLWQYLQHIPHTKCW